MSRHRRSAKVHPAATAIAGAFLAGDWDPPAMARRARRAVGDRRVWILHLARIVRSAHPQRPADRPRELAELIAACEVFTTALSDPARPLRARVRMPVPTEMVAPRWSVPVLDDVAALADWLAVTPGHLDWFADRRSFERSAGDGRLGHHHRRWVTKRDGSPRLLEAPKRELKDLQRQVLHEIVDRIPLHDAAHGFCRGRSARTGAALHHGREVVVRFDLESFFSAVTAGRVYGISRLAGYPEPVAHTLAALCTTVTPVNVLRAAPPVVGFAANERRRRMLSHLTAPHLAQGAPTSPALANLSAYGLDRRLSGLAQRFGATYTRYADDLVISGPSSPTRNRAAVVRLVESIAAQEGFRVDERKTRVATSAARQTVTGLVVNVRSNVERSEYDRLRAVLHDAAVSGPDRANRAGHPDFRAHLQGRIGWVGAENDARAAKLARAFAAINW